MKKLLKSKRGRDGLVELVDNDTAWGLRYSVLVDGKVKASSNDLTAMVRDYDKRP